VPQQTGALPSINPGSVKRENIFQFVQWAGPF
jgi:hypothetical protein